MELIFSFMTETCALDIADRGPATLEEIGDALNLTRERIRQYEEKAFKRLRSPRKERKLLEEYAEGREGYG